MQKLYSNYTLGTLLYCRAPVVEQLKMQVKRISMANYEAHHYDKEVLQEAGLCCSTFISFRAEL